MAGNWTNDKIEDLLGCYEEEEVLWTVTHKDYHKKDVRQGAFIRLSEKLSMSVVDISKKITNLRTYYNKELSKEKKSKVSGSGTDQIYRSKWPFYVTMDAFLRDQVMPRKAISNMDADSDEAIEASQNDEDGDINVEDDNDSQTSTGTRVSQESTRLLGKRKATDRLMNKKKQVKAEDDLLREASSVLKALTADSVSSTKTVKEDDDDIYGKYIATEMRMIKDPRAKQYIKYKIQGLLFEAQCGGNQFSAGFFPITMPSVAMHAPASSYGRSAMYAPASSYGGSAVPSPSSSYGGSAMPSPSSSYGGSAIPSPSISYGGSTYQSPMTSSQTPAFHGQHYSYQIDSQESNE